VGLMGCPRAAGEVVNVGSSREVSIRELAELVVAKTGSKSPIRHIPYSQAYGSGFEDMRRRIPCTAKVRSLIGWEPRLSLDRMIEDTISEHTNHDRQRDSS